MNLKHLESFVRVAEHGSFSRAAQVLGLAQPALSRQVRQLEIDLKIHLLERTGRGVVLTEAGRRLLSHGHAILQEVSRAEDDLAGSRFEPAGHLVLGLPPSLSRDLAVPLVEAFKSQFPKATLSMVEGLSAHIAEWIATGRVDLGLLHHPERLTHIETQPVHTEELVLLGRAASPALTGNNEVPLPLTDLARVGLVIPEPSHAIRRLLEDRAIQAGVRLRVAWEVSSVPAIVDLVAADHGHAILGRRAALAAIRRHPELRMRPVGQPPLSITLCLAASAHRAAAPLQQAVRRLLGELLAPVALERTSTPQE
jgi:LysR family transcriptional regulator, nitrogen assimilation regulatory protein